MNDLIKENPRLQKLGLFYTLRFHTRNEWICFSYEVTNMIHS